MYFNNTPYFDINGDFKENGTKLSDKYLGISAKAADSDKLDGKHLSDIFAHVSPIIGNSDLGVYEYVKIILENSEPNLNEKDNTHYFTPLMWSIHNDNIKIIKLLLDSGADVNFKNNYNQNSMQLAINYGQQTTDYKIIFMLIENGYDWTLKDEDGKDFIERMDATDNYYSSEVVIEKYPEKYKYYLRKKKSKEFNL